MSRFRDRLEDRGYTNVRFHRKLSSSRKEALWYFVPNINKEPILSFECDGCLVFAYCGGELWVESRETDEVLSSVEELESHDILTDADLKECFDEDWWPKDVPEFHYDAQCGTNVKSMWDIGRQPMWNLPELLDALCRTDDVKKLCDMVKRTAR